MTDWNDIGSICRTFGNERAYRMLATRINAGRNFWKEAADEIERLHALVECYEKSASADKGRRRRDGAIQKQGR